MLMKRNAGKKEVAKHEQAQPPAVAPAVPKGLESGVDPKDIIFPRAQMIQPTSEEAADFKVGTLINSLTKEELPDIFIPIVYFKHWIRFQPRQTSHPHFLAGHEPGATIWMSRDPNDPRVQKEAEWGPNNEPPAATAFLSFLSYFQDEAMPIILSFAKTSYGAGKELVSLQLAYPGVPIFARKHKLTINVTKNEKGTFAVMKTKPVGKASEEELAKCEKWWETYSKRAQDIKIHDEETAGKEEAVDEDKPPF